MKKRLHYLESFFKHLTLAKVEIGVGGFLLCFLIHNTLERQNSIRPSPSATYKDTELGFQEQISKDIEMALKTNAQAKSYSEWLSCGYTPLDIFRQVQALNTPEAWSVLCQNLKKLNQDQLALFANEIARPENHPEGFRLCSLSKPLDPSRWNSTGASQKKNSRRPQRLAQIEITVNPRHDPLFLKSDLQQGEFAWTFALSSPLSLHKIKTTEQILRTLSQYQIFATFFLEEKEIQFQIPLVLNILEHGHSIGILSQTPNPTQPELKREIEKQILKTRNTLVSFVKKEAQKNGSNGSENLSFFYQTPPLVSFHSKTIPAELQSFIRKNGLMGLSWNIDTQDWKVKNGASLLQNLVHEMQTQEKGVIRFHNMNEQTAFVLSEVLNGFKRNHYKNVSFLSHPSVFPTTLVYSGEAPTLSKK